MRRLIHTPEGVRDIYGIECDRKRYLERRIEKLLRSYGYQSIETPSFEFFDVFGKDVGTIASRNLYKFFDHEGNTLVLRPDFTPSIARAAAMYFHEETAAPVGYATTEVYLSIIPAIRGGCKESTQMGVELLNDDSAGGGRRTDRPGGLHYADGRADRISGQRGPGGLFPIPWWKRPVMDEDTVEELRKLLVIKNRFGAEELISRLGLRKDLEEAFRQIPELFGNRGDAGAGEEADGKPPGQSGRGASGEDRGHPDGLRLQTVHVLRPEHGEHSTAIIRELLSRRIPMEPATR